MNWNDPSTQATLMFLVSYALSFIRWMAREYQYPRWERDGTFIIDPEDWVY